jgi:citrate lyase subunit beta/citryl-CoA lyase
VIDQEVDEAGESTISRKFEAEGIGMIRRDGKLVNAIHMRHAKDVLHDTRLVRIEVTSAARSRR